MNNPGLPLFVVFVFSTLNESIMEYLFGTVDSLHKYLPLISLATAILLTFTYQVNIFTLVLGIQSNSPFLDFLLTSFVISRISNFINDSAQKILGSK